MEETRETHNLYIERRFREDLKNSLLYFMMISSLSRVHLDVVGGLSIRRIYTKRMIFLKYLKIQIYLNIFRYI